MNRFTYMILSLLPSVRELLGEHRGMRSLLSQRNQEGAVLRDELSKTERLLVEARTERDEWREEAEALQRAIGVLGAEADAFEVARQDEAPPF